MQNILIIVVWMSAICFPTVHAKHTGRSAEGRLSVVLHVITRGTNLACVARCRTGSDLWRR